MTEPPVTELEILLVTQRLHDDLPRWRWILRWETRRTRDRMLRRLVAQESRPEPKEAPPPHAV